MLNKNQSKNSNYWKYFSVLPALIAFVLFFQIEVIAQEKKSDDIEIKHVKIDKINMVITKNTTDAEIKEHCEQIKNLYNIDLTFFNIKRNSNGEIISIKSEFKDNNGSGSSNQSGNTPIKPFKFFYNENDDTMGYTDLDIPTLSKKNKKHIIEEKVDEKELDERIQIKIQKIDTSKTVNQTSNNIQAPVPPTPPTPPNFTFKTPKAPNFPKAPKAPKGDPINGDKKAWKQFENQMQEYEQKMQKAAPSMAAFEKQMEEFEKQMEPFNAEMKVFEKKMKVYEQQMEEYQSKLNSKKQS